MKFVLTPDRDSDNSDPPEIAVEHTHVGSLIITLHDPYRRVEIRAGDWRALVAGSASVLRGPLAVGEVEG